MAQKRVTIGFGAIFPISQLIFSYFSGEAETYIFPIFFPFRASGSVPGKQDRKTSWEGKGSRHERGPGPWLSRTVRGFGRGNATSRGPSRARTPIASAEARWGGRGLPWSTKILRR